MNQLFLKSILIATVTSILLIFSNLVLAEEAEESCDNVLNIVNFLSKQDLFTKSLKEPALRGQIAPSHYDSEMEWFAYFLTSENSELDLSGYVVTIPAAIRHALDRYRTIFYTPGQPIHFFYVVGNSEIRYSSSSQLPENVEPEYLRQENAYAVHPLVRSFEIKIGDRLASYSFSEPSHVVILSRSQSGYGLKAWDDTETLAHEIAHLYTHEIVMWEHFKALDESLAMFKALVTIDDDKNSTLRELSIEDLFAGKTILHHHQVGKILSSGLWNTYLVFKEFLEKKAASVEALHLYTRIYLSRVFSLVESVDSPWLSRSGNYYTYNQVNSVNEQKLEELLNFFSAVSMQFAFELQALDSPISEALQKSEATGLAIDIGLAWRRIGARGPYRRYRNLEKDANGATSLKYSDEKFNGISMPEKWDSPSSLSSYY
ncbi:MAG: hypothetical protein KDD40_04920 [Bdellovibrionales bacterium]|nr:hypothetical protein [Bdellovibrionales bacterium]